MGVIDTSRPGWRIWGRRLVLASLVAVVFGWIPLRPLAGAENVQALRSGLATTRAEIDELRRDNAERRLLIETLKNDERAIEEIARDELGMVYPGELVLRLPEERE